MDKVDERVADGRDPLEALLLTEAQAEELRRTQPFPKRALNTIVRQLDKLSIAEVDWVIDRLRAERNRRVANIRREAQYLKTDREPVP